MSERVGHPDPVRVTWQGANPHGCLPVGLADPNDKRSWHANLGCANTAVRDSLAFLGIDVRVIDVAARARARGAAVYPMPRNPAAAVISELVKSQPGVKVGVDIPGAGLASVPTILRPVILDCLRLGGVVLALVDYDRDMPKGDPTGEHWGSMYAAQAGRLWLADPSTAKRESIDLESLAGPVMWGPVRRPYVVVRGVTIFRA